MNCETSCIGSDPSALSLNLWHDDIYFIYKVYHCITGVALWNILLSTDLHFLIKIDPVIIAIKGGNLSFCSSVCCCTCDCLFFFRICFESGGMGYLSLNTSAWYLKSLNFVIKTPFLLTFLIMIMNSCEEWIFDCSKIFKEWWCITWLKDIDSHGKLFI